jgi:hypothetical protein
VGHWNDIIADEKRSGSDKIALRWPKREFKYHWEWLALACQIEDANNIVILNPRNIQASSLKEADRIWLRDKGRYRRGLRFVRDKDKRAKAGLG